MKKFYNIFLIVMFCYNCLNAQLVVDVPKPENVLVVYRAPSGDPNDHYYHKDNLSEDIATYYKQARGIPNENMLSLVIPSEFVFSNHTVGVYNENEIIIDLNGNNDQDFSSIYNQTMQYVKQYITQPIEDYLNNTLINDVPLAERIRFIVVCKGVPLKIQSGHARTGDSHPNLFNI